MDLVTQCSMRGESLENLHIDNRGTCLVECCTGCKTEQCNKKYQKLFHIYLRNKYFFLPTALIVKTKSPVVVPENPHIFLLMKT